MHNDMNLLHTYIETEKLKGLKKATLYEKEYYLKRFLKDQVNSLLQITENEIRGYITALQKEYSSTFSNKMIQHLRSLYLFLSEEGLALFNPMKGIDRIEKTVPQQSVFSEEEVRKILKTIPETVLGRRDRALLELLYSTGLRISEALALTIDDIDTIYHEIMVRNGKGGVERIVPIGTTALSYIESYLEERLTRWGHNHYHLFCSQKGNPLDAKAVREMIKKYKHIANVTTPGSTHTFRRSCATHLLKHGVPLALIQRLLGHTSLESTYQYTLIEIHDLQQIHTTIFTEVQPCDN